MTLLLVGVLAFLVAWGNVLDPLVYLYEASQFATPGELLAHAPAWNRSVSVGDHVEFRPLFHLMLGVEQVHPRVGGRKQLQIAERHRIPATQLRVMLQHPQAALRCEHAADFRQGEAVVAGKLVPSPLLGRFGPRWSAEGGADLPTDWASARG